MGYSLNVVKAVEKANDYQKSVLMKKLLKHFHNSLKNKTIGVWGLAFKPQTDDIREASSIFLIRMLLKEGAKIKAYDPAAMDEAGKILGKSIIYAPTQYDAVSGADALALMTEWPEFRIPDLRLMAIKMKEKVIFDGRNIYEPAEIKEAGFVYYGIGRG